MAKAPKKKQLGGLISAARRLMKSPVTKRTTNKIKKEVTGEYYNLKNAMKEIKKRSNNSPKKKQMGGMPPVPVDSMKKYLPPPPSSGKVKKPIAPPPANVSEIDRKTGDPTQIQRLKPYKQMGGKIKRPVVRPGNTFNPDKSIPGYKEKRMKEENKLNKLRKFKQRGGHINRNVVRPGKNPFTPKDSKPRSFKEQFLEKRPRSGNSPSDSSVVSKIAEAAKTIKKGPPARRNNLKYK